MDSQAAAIHQSNPTGVLDIHTYTPFVGDANWYTVARGEYIPIYMYKASDEGISITEIRRHLVKKLPYPRGYKPSKPNGITVQFPDTSNQGLSPYGQEREHIIFDMNPTTQIPQIMTLLSIARSDSPDLVPQFVEADNAHPIWPGTALSHPLLRELLLVMALRSFLMQAYRLAPGAEDLVKHIASSGPPVVPHGVPRAHGEPFVSVFHRGWIWNDEGSKHVQTWGLRLRLDVEAALVRGGWRDPKKGVEYLAPGPPPFSPWDEGKKLRPQEEEKNSGMCELVDALLDVGYLDTNDKRADVLAKVARYGVLRDVEFTLGKIERDSISLAQECEILPAAAAGGKGRADVLEFLLNSGLDPNTVSQGNKRTALHVAIRHGDVDMLRVLLEAGANMVKDEEWGLPIEAAEGLVDREDGAAKVALLERWLEERGLPRDHVDLPVFVDENGSSHKKRSWAARTAGSGSGCCKTCGTRSGQL
ncbi:hypothetical protein QBC37DRAFT_458347 [Rhypophila decipiens]|uniref:Uncharacterized protein n=1 Tax=Rhypophila decipiens TaxID=261697 RepID=A0AAN6XU06_9PEZI|nr:hypothetical protein QBC37DRAFT_458347 [Rhypophila decipiens]